MNFRHLACLHNAKTPEFTPFQNLPATSKAKNLNSQKNSNQTLKFCYTDKVLVILVKLSYRLVLPIFSLCHTERNRVFILHCHTERSEVSTQNAENGLLKIKYGNGIYRFFATLKMTKCVFFVRHCERAKRARGNL